MARGLNTIGLNTIPYGPQFQKDRMNQFQSHRPIRGFCSKLIPHFLAVLRGWGKQIRYF